MQHLVEFISEKKVSHHLPQLTLQMKTVLPFLPGTTSYLLKDQHCHQFRDIESNVCVSKQGNK